MKKFLSVLFVVFLSAFSLNLNAQENVGVAKFLGIPVDGSKSAMIAKLQRKGFTYNRVYDCLKGEFNGKSVELHVVTNRNKVWRIAVFGPSQSETDVKISYNQLVNSFLAKDNYLCIDTGYVEEDEYISSNKRIESSFCQLHDGINKEMFFDKQEILKHLHDIGNDSLANQLNTIPDDKFQELMSFIVPLSLSKDPSQVWFMISETYDVYTPYRILLFYDNRRNNRDGEDL